MQKREKFLPFFSPTIGEDEVNEVVETIRSGWLTTGSRTHDFEQQFAQYVGVKHAIGLTSCTAALHLALLAHGIGSGDEVLVPSFTFAATANVIVHVGATPIFVDIREDTFNIDLEDAKRKVTSKTKAIIPVHYAGQSIDVTSFNAFASENKLVVIEDAAHSVGASYSDSKTGSHGNTTCFSFYANKNMTTGEGGMLTTNDDEIAQKVRLLRLHGMSKDAWKRYSAKGSWRYDIVNAGWKYNMFDLQAALGMHQLRRIDSFVAKRNKLARLYDDKLSLLSGVRIPFKKPNVTHAYHLYPILLENHDRDEFIEKMKEYNIGVSVHFIPLHMQPFYQQNYPVQEGSLPVTESVFKRVVSLPLYPEMNEDDVEYVANVIKEILSNKTKGEIMKEITIGDKKIGGNNPVFIVAEIGINFDGKFDQAIALIDAAANAGCDAVKYQLFTAEKMYTVNAGDYQVATGEKKDIIQIVKDGELPEDWIPKLREYAHSRRLLFFSTVCDEDGGDVLDKQGVPVFKMTSYAITHIPLLRHMVKKQKPVIFSCGGATMREVAEAVDVFKDEGNTQGVLMHCIAKYPTPLNETNLNVVKTLQAAFPSMVIGYSDHTSDPVQAPVAAVALGAKVIEKHITLDRSLPGPDHSFALEPHELKAMVNAIRDTERKMALGETINLDPILLGSTERTMAQVEQPTRDFAYRCVFATKDIKKGELLTPQNMAVLRPGEKRRGLEPKYYELFVNKCRASRDIPLGASLQWNDVLDMTGTTSIPGSISSSHQKRKVSLVIQARMASTRLPGKVLKKIGDKTLLEILVERLKQCTLADEIIVVTSENPLDDQIAYFCQKRNITCVRGSEEDVLGRYVKAVKDHDLDVVVRICSDNPLLSPQFIDQMITDFIGSGVDYAFSSSAPDGIKVEVTDARNLLRLDSVVDNPFREHVTYYMLKHPEEFTQKDINFGGKVYDVRLTVDTMRDFALIEALFAHFGDLTLVDSARVLTFLEENVTMREINQEVSQFVPPEK